MADKRNESVGRKGECGGTPRVGKKGDPKPKGGRRNMNRPRRGRKGK